MRQRLPELRVAGDEAEAAYERFAGTFEIDPFDKASARIAASALRDARELQWSIAAEIYIDTYGELPRTARAEMLALRDRALRPTSDIEAP